MLEVFAYMIALILLAVAALVPTPYRDRIAYGGLALWLLPTAVHALQAH